MKRVLTLCLLIGIVAPLLIAQSDEDRYDLLSIAPVEQIGDYWCYAACAEMICQFFNTSLSQCNIVAIYKASSVTPDFSCCAAASAMPFRCIASGGACDVALEMLGYRCEPEESERKILDFGEIEEQISGATPSPVLMTVYWTNWEGSIDNSKHQMLIRGYEEYEGIHYVYVNDPSPFAYKHAGGVVDDWMDGGDVYWYELDALNSSADLARIPDGTREQNPTDVFNFTRP